MEDFSHDTTLYAARSIGPAGTFRGQPRPLSYWLDKGCTIRPAVLGKAQGARYMVLYPDTTRIIATLHPTAAQVAA